MQINAAGCRPARMSRRVRAHVTGGFPAAVRATRPTATRVVPFPCHREGQRDMSGADPSTRYLGELKAFLKFLRNLWGLLASVSVFFPLSNLLLRTVPLGAYGEEGVFDLLPPALLTTLATVVTLFVVLATFAGRRRFAEAGQRRGILRAAWATLGGGVLSLLAYLVLHQIYREYAWQPWGWGSGDPRKLLAEIPLLVAYVVFFSLLTRAFMLMGMLEFFGGGDARRDAA